MTTTQRIALLGQLAGQTAAEVADDLGTTRRAVLKLWRLAKQQLSEDQRARYEQLVNRPEFAMHLKPFSLQITDHV